MFVRFTATWVASFGLYLLFAGELSLSELGTAVVAAAAIAIFSVGLAKQKTRSFRFLALWPRLIWVPLFSLMPDSWRVGRVLVSTVWRARASTIGVFQKQSFQHGGNTREAAGRRGLATLAISFAPNGYVVEINDVADEMLIHRLRSSAPKADTRWPL